MIQALEQLSQCDSNLCRAVRFVSEKTLRRANLSGQLGPKTPVAPHYQTGLPEWAYESHLFAIEEGELTKWTDNEQFPCIMKNLMSHVKGGYESRKVAKLSFDVRTSDEPFVLDFAHRANTLYERNSLIRLRNFLEGYYLGATKEWKYYIGSRVPYVEYRRDFILPEIAIPKPIPIDRFVVESIS